MYGSAQVGSQDADDQGMRASILQNAKLEPDTRVAEYEGDLAEFEFVLGDLRPLLTESECEELETLETRLSGVKGDRARLHAVLRDVRYFVQGVLAGSH